MGISTQRVSNSSFFVSRYCILLVFLPTFQNIDGMEGKNNCCVEDINDSDDQDDDGCWLLSQLPL